MGDWRNEPPDYTPSSRDWRSHPPDYTPPKRDSTPPPQRQEKRDAAPQPPSFKRGGRVHRTGIYKLHRGERVIPARSRRARRR